MKRALLLVPLSIGLALGLLLYGASVEAQANLAPRGDITSVSATAGGGLVGGATSGAASLGMKATCSSGETLLWDGDSWECGAAGGSYTAGDGLTLTASDFDLTHTSDFTITSDQLDLSTAVTMPGTCAVAGNTDLGNADTDRTKIFGELWVGPMAETATSLAAGQHDDYDPGSDATTLIFDVHANGATISGMVPPASGRGSIRFIETGTSSGPLTILNQSTDSSVPNRIITPDKLPLTIPKNSGVILHALSDATHSWRVIAAATTRFSRMAAKGLQVNDALAPDELAVGTTHDWDLDLLSSGGGTVPGNVDLYSRVQVTTSVVGATLTGIYPPLSGNSEDDGRILILENIGDTGSVSATVTLKHYDSGSIAGARFVLPGSADMVIPIWGTVILVYDTTYNWWHVAGSNFGDITSVVAGAGLTGGATAGAATVDITASSDFSVGADLLDLSNAVTAPGSVAIAGDTDIGNASSDTVTITAKVDSHVYYTGSTPTGLTCGSGASFHTAANDRRGTIEIGTGSPATCSFTFSTSWTNNPVCIAVAKTGTLAVSGVSTSTLEITPSNKSAGDLIHYHCDGVLAP
jgi:hypothetical protein